jgi:hypothetical protein
MSRGKKSPLVLARTSRNDLPAQGEDLRPTWRFMNHVALHEPFEDDFSITISCQPTRKLVKLLQKFEVDFYQAVGETKPSVNMFPDHLEIFLEGSLNAMMLTKMNPQSPIAGERVLPLLLCADTKLAASLTKSLMYQILPLFPDKLQAKADGTGYGVIGKYLLMTELETLLKDKSFKISSVSREYLQDLKPVEIVAYAHQRDWMANPTAYQAHQLAASHTLLHPDVPILMNEKERVAMLEFLAYLAKRDNQLAINELRRLY